MRRILDRRLGRLGGEAGFTLIEMLVASAMSIVVLGGVGSLLISTLHDQPVLTQKAANIQTARWVLERLTRELRDGVVVDKATASSVSFQTYVRHSTCGGSTMLPSTSASIKCEVTYTCSGGSCTRVEAAPGVYTGTATVIFEGLNNSSSVFTYSPSTTSATYVGVTLAIPNPSGGGATTVSDGVSLRNATLND
jgi:prepilin-type N-terminal cleavage/methylation domain-containing protein